MSRKSSWWLRPQRKGASNRAALNEAKYFMEHNKVLQERINELAAENVKLRELCADMFDGMCDHDHCYTCHHWKDGYNGCEYHERMAQLGIEVD